jgi:hypothetical protein
MTNTLISRLSGPPPHPLFGPPPHPTAVVPTGDRLATPSADSFPASIAPGWTVATCIGAPRTNGSLRNEEQL